MYSLVGSTVAYTSVYTTTAMMVKVAFFFGTSKHRFGFFFFRVELKAAEGEIIIV